MQKLRWFAGLGVTQGHRKHRYLIERIYIHFMGSFQGVSQHQNWKLTILDFNEAQNDGLVVISDGQYTNYLHFVAGYTSWYLINSVKAVKAISKASDMSENTHDEKLTNQPVANAWRKLAELSVKSFFCFHFNFTKMCTSDVTYSVYPSLQDLNAMRPVAFKFCGRDHTHARTHIFGKPAPEWKINHY